MPTPYDCFASMADDEDGIFNTGILPSECRNGMSKGLCQGKYTLDVGYNAVANPLSSLSFSCHFRVPLLKIDNIYCKALYLQ